MSTQTGPLRREILVVTGASTGIGAATARELARRGFHVLAGVRRGSDADALRATNLEPIVLDIKSRGSGSRIPGAGSRVPVPGPRRVRGQIL
jgi:NAD(P)-dependent dehydrogenase (short-subunit alcohol dehydrogenase family)